MPLTRLCQFCSVVLRRFLAFGVRGRRWSELELKETLKMLYLYYLSVLVNFKRVKRENRQQNRKVAEYVLNLIPHPFSPFEFFLEFWRYMVFIFRWSCLFWYFTGDSYKVMNAAIFSFCSSLFPFNNMSGLQSANPVFCNKTIALVLSWFLS